MPALLEKVKTKLNRDLLVLLGVLLVYALAALVCRWQLRQSFFAADARVLGADCGGLEAPEAARRLADTAAGKTLRLVNERGVALGELALTELLGETDWPQVAADALRAQRQGGEAALTPPEAPALEAKLEALLCGEGYVPVEPEDAELLLDEQGAHILPDTPGNIPRLDVCAAALEAYLQKGEFLAPDAPEELIIKDALRTARVTADDPALLRSLRTLRRYTAQTLTVEFCGGVSHTLTPAQLADVARLEKLPGRTRVSVDREALAALLGEIAEALGGDGVDAKYGRVGSTREYIYLSPGDEGYRLDREALCEEVAAALESGAGGTIAARYDQLWWLSEVYGRGKPLENVIEISLDNQYLWFYRDGELLIETPVTTGNVASRDETRRGSFGITFLLSDTYLDGPTWHYHVDYWIPFDGDIGLHDSYWRTAYGADYYLTEGSHGCVNTPLDAIRTIFENSYYNMPVIVR